MKVGPFDEKKKLQKSHSAQETKEVQFNPVYFSKLEKLNRSGVQTQ